jgi:hypothetical protein
LTKGEKATIHTTLLFVTVIAIRLISDYASLAHAGAKEEALAYLQLGKQAYSEGRVAYSL